VPALVSAFTDACASPPTSSATVELPPAISEPMSSISAVGQCPPIVLVAVRGAGAPICFPIRARGLHRVDGVDASADVRDAGVGEGLRGGVGDEVEGLAWRLGGAGPAPPHVGHADDHRDGTRVHGSDSNTDKICL
jgi:hypothetical protein